MSRLPTTVRPRRPGLPLRVLVAAVVASLVLPVAEHAAPVARAAEGDPSVRLAGSVTVTSPVRASFSEPVGPLTSANFVLRRWDGWDFGGRLVCRDGAGGLVTCSGQAIRTAELWPSSALTAGERYRATVDPAGAAPARDAESVAVPTTSLAFSAPFDHQETSAAVVQRWRRTADSRALGGWYVSDRQPGAEAIFRFEGTGVTWYTMRGPDQGLALVYIDGVLKGSFNQYAATTSHRVPRAFGGLSAGRHTIVVRARGMKGSASATDSRVTVDAFAVGRSLYTSPSLAFRWRRVGTSAASGGTYATSDLRRSTIDLAFRGTGVHWYTVLGPGQGKAAIYLDGSLHSVVDGYRSTTYYGARRSITGLADRVHRLRIRVLGERSSRATGTAVAVDLLRVIPGPGAPPSAARPEPTPSPSWYTRNLPVRHVEQQTNRWCVPAAVQMELRQQGFTPPSQRALYDEGLYLKRCNVGIDRGLDPLAWARLLYRHSGAGRSGRYYDDFLYSGPYSGTRAMIRQLYVYNEVAGALVNRGHHAFVFKGATTSCNPASSACAASSYVIQTVYVEDPWYDRSVASPGKDGDGCSGTGGTYTCGRIGLRPNSAISYPVWAAYYYTSWGNQPYDCRYWNGRWVAVLRRSASGAPTSTATAAGPTNPATRAEDGARDATTAGAPTELPTQGRDVRAPATSPRIVRAASARPPDLDRAFGRAAHLHGLTTRRELRAALDGGRAARSYRVRSLSPGFPDYLLATVVGRGGLRGVAMFILDGGRVTFAGMTYADRALRTYPAISARAARAAVDAAGERVTGRPELVWGWSAESRSPYYPFYRVATAAGDRFVDSHGAVHASLDLDQGPGAPLP